MTLQGSVAEYLSYMQNKKMFASHILMSTLSKNILSNGHSANN